MFTHQFETFSLSSVCACENFAVQVHADKCVLSYSYSFFTSSSKSPAQGYLVCSSELSTGESRKLFARIKII